MTKRVGLLGLILAAAMAVFQPAAALAQDRNYHDRDYRDRGRREERAYRYEERRDFRAPIERGREWRGQPCVDRSYRDRSYGYVYSNPGYYGYAPAYPYNCR